MKKKKINKKRGKKKRQAPRNKAVRTFKDKPIGQVTHYFRKIGVAIVRFKKPVRVGTSVEFRGATTDFSDTISSMQLEHKSVNTAPKGKQVGVRVKKRVRDGDGVFIAR